MIHFLRSLFDNYLPAWIVNWVYLIVAALLAMFGGFMPTALSEVLVGFYTSIFYFAGIQLVVLGAVYEIVRRLNKFRPHFVENEKRFALRTIGYVGVLGTLIFAFFRFRYGADEFEVVGVLLYSGFFFDLIFRQITYLDAEDLFAGIFGSSMVVLIILGGFKYFQSERISGLTYLEIGAMGIGYFGVRILVELFSRKFNERLEKARRNSLSSRYADKT